MTYSPQTWTDDDPATPISAARLAHMETGIDEAHDDIATLDTALTGVANGLTDLETEVGAIVDVPAGGATGEVLAKQSNTSGDVGWEPPGAAINGLPTGGTATQVLAKASSTDFDAEWVDAATGGGGGGLAWEQVIDLPLTTLTGWTVSTGTWALSGGGQIRQTNLGATGDYLSLDESIANNLCYAEVEIKFAASGGNIYAGIMLGPGNGGVLARYQREGGVWSVKLERAVLGTVALAAWPSGAEATWFKIGAYFVGNSVALVDDTGVRRLSGIITGDTDTSHLGLFAYGTDVEFRNLKVYTLAADVADAGAGAGISDPTLLGVTAYRAATDDTFSTTSTTLVDVNAANLHVPFTVPDSGSVIVQVNALVNSGSNRGRIGLRDASGIIPDTLQYVSSGDFAHMSTYRVVVDGLTPGDELDWRLAFAHSAGNTMSIYSGPEFGQITMTVHDAEPGAAGGAGAAGGGWASVDNPTSYEDAFGADLGFDYEFEAVGTTLPTGWSWVNQGSCTYKEQLGAGILTVPSGGADDVHMIVQSLAGAPSTFVAIAKCCMNSPIAAGSHFGGLVLRDSTTGEFSSVYAKPYTGAVLLEHWNSPTSFNSSAGGPSIGDASSVEFYVKVVKNSGSDWDFYWSRDGRAWSTVALNVNEGSFLTIDQIGFMINAAVGDGSYNAELSFDFIRLR